MPHNTKISEQKALHIQSKEKFRNMENQLTEEVLKRLKEPLSSKWRVQSTNTRSKPPKCVMVAYNDARDIQDRLDDVVGVANWQTKFYECKGKQFCEIGIKINGEWIWKGDSGSESKTEADKGETSDSFKRAAVHWGINRTAYKYGTVSLPAKEYNGRHYPADDRGNFLKGDALHSVCNKLAKVEDFQAEYEESIKAPLN